MSVELRGWKQTVEACDVKNRTLPGRIIGKIDKIKKNLFQSSLFWRVENLYWFFICQKSFDFLFENIVFLSIQELFIFQSSHSLTIKTLLCNS